MIEPIAIEKYCDVLKDKIMFDKFNLGTHISGNSIKSLTEVPQINSFVFRSVFEEWKKEADKLKSPFFDFDHPDVKDALHDFMNKLSFQIKINKEYFEVILKKSLHDAFEYLESPIFFLQEDIFKFTGNVLSFEEIKKRTKFLKFYPSALESFLSNPQINNELVRLDVLMKVIEDEFEHVDITTTTKVFIGGLEKIAPNNFINLIETKPIINKPEVKSSLIETVEETQNDSMTDQHVRSSINSEIPSIETNANTLNLSTIATMAEGISLQQKFYFVKELFDMEEDTYTRVVEKADDYLDYDTACNALWEENVNKFQWMEKEEPVAEFFSILSRKFI